MEKEKKVIVVDYYDNIKDHSKGDEEFLSVFMYGKPGSGKTKTLGTFPKPFVFDTDGGLLTIYGQDIKSFPVTSDMDVYATFMNMIQDIKHRKGPFAQGGILGDRKTIAIDSMSETAIRMFAKIMEVQSKDTRAAYQTLLSQLTTLTSLFRELKLYGYHVVATAGEDFRESNQSGIMEPVPLIPGGFRDYIAHQFDQSLWMEVMVQSGKATYNAYSLKEKGHAAKDRIGLPQKVQNITFDMMKEALKKKISKEGK